MMSKKNSSNLTVNWHFLPDCNMACKYCFIPKMPKSLSLDSQKIIIKKLACYFNRINFVGGEPTLGLTLLPMIKYAKALGMKTSIVTNGYRMVSEIDYAMQLIDILDCIGLSVDSLNSNTNLLIGRCNGEKTVSEQQYLQLAQKIKNAGKILKINTVVNTTNLNEDFTSFYRAAKPNKIKLFQVYEPDIQLKRDYHELCITEAEFNSVVSRYSNLKSKTNVELRAENNSVMQNSYFMLHSGGYFVDNSRGLQQQNKSPSLLEPGMTVSKALEYIDVDMEKYTNRYKIA